MTTKKLSYCGSSLWAGLDFNLYGYEDIDHKNTKDSVLNTFKGQYVEQIKKALKSLGLTYLDLDYYSPKAYNFAGDSIDLHIKPKVNKTLLRTAIKKNTPLIDKALSKNKSYDGYSATTVYDSMTELENLESSGYEPDILVLSTLLNLMVDFKDFDPVEHFDFLPMCDECDMSIYGGECGCEAKPK